MGCDLKFEIGPGGSDGTYRIDVDSPAGATSGVLRLDVDALLRRRREIAACVLASAVKTRAGPSVQERPVREIGQALFEGLFADSVYGRYTASVQEASRRGEPLRVVLRLRAPELAGLPWETLFDPEARQYLCQREPVVRYVETPQAAAPLRLDLPLRILGLIAAPRDLPRLDVAEEQRRLEDALADLRGARVELVWARDGSWPALQQLLLEGPWHIVHFVGHGGLDEAAGGGVLELEREDTRRAAHVSAGRFANLLHVCRPVPRLVVLNACQSGEAAADDLLSSTAAALVHSGIGAAVAMQFAVTDPAALAFARGFYQAIARGLPVDEAVRLGRIAIDGTAEETLEWVTPVLYLRTDDTRLFDVAPGDRQTPAGPPEEDAERAASHALYVDALAAMHGGRDHDALALLDRLLAREDAYRDASELRGAVGERASGEDERAGGEDEPVGGHDEPVAPRATKVLRDVVAAAAVAALIAGAVRAFTRPVGGGDTEKLVALAGGRTLGWALVVAAVAAVMARHGGPGGRRQAVVAGGAAGLLGGLVHGVLRFQLDISTQSAVDGGTFPLAPVLGLVLTGLVAGAYLGSRWNASAAGAAGGLAGGALAGFVAFSAIAETDDNLVEASVWVVHAVPICVAAVGLAFVYRFRRSPQRDTS